MGLIKKMYAHFILESVGFFLMAFVIGAVSSSVVNVFIHADYLLSLFSVYAILNLIVAITVKGFLEREYSSFCSCRKELIRINLSSDLLIAVLEAILLGGIIKFANSFTMFNQKMRLIDMSDSLNAVPMAQHIAFFFLLVTAVEAVVTFDFMCNKGALQSFFSVSETSGGKGIKQGILSVAAYMVMTVLLALAVAVFTQVEEQYIRSCVIAGLFVITVVFYVLAVYKVRRKEFNVENV